MIYLSATLSPPERLLHEDGQRHDDRRFNVSLIVRGKVTRQYPQTTTFFFKRKESRSGIEPRPFCLPA